MSEKKILVAWGKQKFDVSVTPDTSLQSWQEHLQALTGVLVPRQKFIVKGKRLKTDEDVRNLEPGTKVLMMGVATELPKPPKEEIVFMEDLSASERAEAGVRVGAGLKNLGNTCYMNSSIQALKGVPELRTALVDSSKNGASGGGNLHVLMGRLFKELDSSEDSIVPGTFTVAFRSAFPQFDEKDSHGFHKQQDAEECFSQLMTVVADRLQNTDGITLGPVTAVPDPDSSYLKMQNVVDQLFGGQLDILERNTEAPEEPVTQRTENFRRLQCHIDSDTNYLFQGLERNLKEEREKNSPTLGRNAIYEQTSRISALPPYLVVQFVRFYWRKDNNQKAKICRRVKYPAQLDVMPFVNDELRSSLGAARRLNAEREDERLGLKKENEKMDIVEDQKSNEQDGKQEGKEAEKDDLDLPPHPVTSGMYQISAVVTHQGRMADSGHYVGWVRQEGQDWLMFDDDKVKPVKESDILQLDGSSADWHMSYLIIYKRIDDMTEEGQKEKAEQRKRDEEARLAKRA